jgi:hypothetical protein
MDIPVNALCVHSVTAAVGVSATIDNDGVERHAEDKICVLYLHGHLNSDTPITLTMPALLDMTSMRELRDMLTEALDADPDGRS